jgi:hypothetical protein
MRFRFHRGALLLALAAFSITAPAAGLEEEKAGRHTVQLTSSSRPVVLRASTKGSISVEAYGGNAVVIEAVPDEARRGEEAGDGLKIAEKDNVVIVSSLRAGVDLRIQVPVRTSLRVAAFQGGGIRVTGVHGDHELSNTNGPIEARQVSGSVVANTLNGRILVTFTKITPDKAMAFSSLNGGIDVTFPATTRANLRIRTLDGNVHSDFEIIPDRPPSKNLPEGLPGRGLTGTVNGGGPEFLFKTLNGDIRLRRGGS